MDEDEHILRYDRMVENALRGVVRRAVEEVIEDSDGTGGMPGDHHFYITFLTDYPGVNIPDYLARALSGRDDDCPAIPVLSDLSDRRVTKSRSRCPSTTYPSVW